MVSEITASVAAAYIQKASENASKPAQGIEQQAAALMVSAKVSEAREYARAVSPIYAKAEAATKAARNAQTDALNIHVPEAALTLSQAREARGKVREGAGIKDIVGMVKNPQENISVLAAQYEKALTALKVREREISGKK